MSVLAASPTRLMQDMSVLCNDIGVRLAGSKSEAQAAEFVASRFREMGLDTQIQEFPCLTYAPQQEELQVKIGGRWQASRCTSVAHSPSTPSEGIEGRIAYLGKGTAAEIARADTSGAIGLMWGTIGGGASTLERLSNCGLAALLMVDERYPVDWPIAVGLPAGWIKLLTIPAAAMPYPAAWEIMRSGATEAHLKLQVEVTPSVSQNVIAELPGHAGLAPVIISGHHDTVINCVGADDNAAGTVCAIEAARLLQGQGLRRPVRFIAFGAEEQLSEGARMYALNPANKADETAFVVNLDAVGTWAGEDLVYFTGARELMSYTRKRLDEAAMIATVKGEISPFSDQYPFNRVGVPSVWFYRMNTADGRWHHHASHDSLDVISPQVLAMTATAATHIAHDLAARDEMPFPREFPAAHKRAIAGFERDVFGPYED